MITEMKFEPSKVLSFKSHSHPGNLASYWYPTRFLLRHTESDFKEIPTVQKNLWITGSWTLRQGRQARRSSVRVSHLALYQSNHRVVRTLSATRGVGRLLKGFRRNFIWDWQLRRRMNNELNFSQNFEGLVLGSAVSTPIFESKYSLESSRRDLQDLRTFAPL